jgi:hypothetical protein
MADNCGVCDSDLSNNCVADCAGVMGGTAFTDDCDQCVGGTTGPFANYLMDECDVCGGDGIPEGACDCDGNVEDCEACGEYVSLWDECYSIASTTIIQKYLDSDDADENFEIEIGGIPPEIGQLVNLEILDIEFLGVGCKVYNFDKDICIEYCDVMNGCSREIPPEIGNLTNLIELDLGHNFLIPYIPPEIGNLTNLTNLVLRYLQRIYDIEDPSVGIPPEIGNLINLNILDLRGNSFTGEIPQAVCDLIESNNLDMENITDDNDFIPHRD